jgi:hypothetical protein
MVRKRGILFHSRNILVSDEVGTGATAVDKYKADKQEEQKNTNCIAMAAYIQGNTGERDAYTDGNIGFAMSEALLKRDDGEELTDLAVLHKKYDSVIPSKKKDCPTWWEADLQHIDKKMEKAGASHKMDVEIIAHIMNTTTMVRDQTHMGINPIKKVIAM